jgi:hypothetical protein
MSSELRVAYYDLPGIPIYVLMPSGSCCSPWPDYVLYSRTERSALAAGVNDRRGGQCRIAEL